MKTCNQCGAGMEDTSKFCPSCGAKCDANENEGHPAYQISDGPSNSLSTNLPMKWHKFMMVIMIIGAVATIISGVSTMTGLQYKSGGMEAEQVYSYFPGLRVCDICYGIVLIAIGIYEFIVRNRLNQFRKNGPSSLTTIYIISIAASILYLCWTSAILKASTFDSSNTGSLISSIVLLIINRIYYSKRSDMFTN